MIPVPRARPVQYLEPREILLLDYSQGFSTDQEHYHFWEYQYGINVLSKLHDLINRGLLTLGDRCLTLNSRRIAELKALLRAHGLKISGRKADLVDRVLAHVSEADIDTAFPERRYVLTDLGRTAVTENEYIGYVHSHRLLDLGIDTIAAMVNEAPQYPWRDLIWSHLNQMLITSASRGAWGLYRNVTLSMAEFVAEESRWADALAFLAEVIFLDMNQLYRDEMPPDPVHRTSTMRIPPGIVERAREWSNHAGLNDDDLRVLMLNRPRPTQALGQVFTPEETVHALLRQLKGDHQQR